LFEQSVSNVYLILPEDLKLVERSLFTLFTLLRRFIKRCPDYNFHDNPTSDARYPSNTKVPHSPPKRRKKEGEELESKL